MIGEEVARAMRRNRFARTRRIASFDETVPPTNEELDDARAALSALLNSLLDPSEEVIQAGRAALASIEGWKLTPGIVFPLASVKMVRAILRAAALKIEEEAYELARDD